MPFIQKDEKQTDGILTESPLEIAAELGDFDPVQHTPGYISEFQFMPNQSQDLEARVSELHKRLVYVIGRLQMTRCVIVVRRGQVPAAAESAFLQRVQWLDLYGADLHPVLVKRLPLLFLNRLLSQNET